MYFMNKFEFLVNLYSHAALTTTIQFMFLIKIIQVQLELL